MELFKSLEKSSGTTRSKSYQYRKYVGLVLLVACIVMLVIHSELLPYLQSQEAYRKPFLMMWLAHSYFIVIYPVHWLISWVKNVFSPQQSQDPTLEWSLRGLFNDQQQEKLSLVRLGGGLFLRCLIFTLPFTVETFFWYYAAGFSTPARITVIYNSSGCFAYFFEILLMGERLKPLKLLAVFLGTTGVMMISLLGTDPSTGPGTGPDITHPNNFLMGDLIAIGSAFLAGLSDVIYKKLLVPKGQFSFPFSSLVNSLVGLINLSLFWFPIPLLHLLKFEPLQFPTKRQLLLLFLVTVVGFLYDTVYMLSITMTGPVWSSIGILLSIPLITLVDWFLSHKPPSWNFVAGTVVIIVAFLLLMNDDFELQYSERTDNDGVVAAASVSEGKDVK